MNTLTVLAEAAVKEVEKYGRGQWLDQKDPAKPFVATFYKLKRQYITNHSDETCDDILTEAWIYVFSTNGRKNIKDFVGHNPETGNSLTIYTYFSILMRNAIINASKERKKFYDHELTPNYEYNEDGEQASFDDFASYFSNISKSSPCHRVDDEYVETLHEYIRELQTQLDDIQRNRKLVKDKQKAIKSINKSIEKLQKQIKEELGDLNKPQIDPEAYNTQSESENPFDSHIQSSTILSLVSQVYNKAVIQDIENSDELLLTLLGLLSGLSPQEIALFLDTDYKHINNLISELKDYIILIASEMEFEEKDSSLLHYVSLFRDAKHTKEKNIVLSRAQVCRIMRQTLKDYLHYISEQQSTFKSAHKNLLLCISSKLKELFPEYLPKFEEQHFGIQA